MIKSEQKNEKLLTEIAIQLTKEQFGDDFRLGSTLFEDGRCETIESSTDAAWGYYYSKRIMLERTFKKMGHKLPHDINSLAPTHLKRK